MKKLFTFLMTVLIGATTLFATSCDPYWYNYVDGDKYTAGAPEVGENITAIDIGWYGGEICVEYAAVETITVSETADKELEEDTKQHHWIDGETLHIQYCLSGLMFSYGTPIEKTLTLLIPQEMVLQKLEIESLSANISITDLSVNDVEIDNHMGKTQASFISVNEVEIEQGNEDGTVSFVNAPKTGDFSFDGSGILTIKFPAETGFTAEIKKEVERAKINFDFEIARYGEEYICGDGVNQYDFELGYGGTINVQKLS